ncbi:hypothetical protein CR513_42963, partial [Mucuna pruriens]
MFRELTQSSPRASTLDQVTMALSQKSSRWQQFWPKGSRGFIGRGSYAISVSTTQGTPFRLTFETDVVTPIEIRESSPRTTFFRSTLNEEEIRANLDLLQEDWEVVHVRDYATKARAS